MFDFIATPHHCVGQVSKACHTSVSFKCHTVLLTGPMLHNVSIFLQVSSAVWIFIVLKVSNMAIYVIYLFASVSGVCLSGQPHRV